MSLINMLILIDVILTNLRAKKIPQMSFGIPFQLNDADSDFYLK